MSSIGWLSTEQIAQLRAALLREREQLRKNGMRGGSIRAALVAAALVRLDGGTYGECVACEEPLAFDALRRRPEAPLCDECERARKRVTLAGSSRINVVEIRGRDREPPGGGDAA